MGTLGSIAQVTQEETSQSEQLEQDELGMNREVKVDKEKILLNSYFWKYYR